MQKSIQKTVTFTLVLFLVYSLSIFPDVNAVSSDAWAIIKSMQVARSFPGVAVVNNRIYAIGGDGLYQIGWGETHRALNVTEEYDPETDTWVFKKNIPTSRYQFAVAVYHGLVYCIGGQTDDGVTAVNEVYNPSTDTWETRASMPTPRMNMQAHILDGQIYVISTGATEVYDPETDTWTTKTACPNRITSGASAVADNKIYFLATFDSQLDLGAFVQVYDPKNDVWSKAGRAPSYGSSAATANVAVSEDESKKIVFFKYDSTLIYYPRNDSWAQGTPVSGSRGYAGVTLLNDVYCVIGGIKLPFLFTQAASSVATAQQYMPNEHEPIAVGTKIYIRSDGSIEPSTANITTTDNVTYKFTANNLGKTIVIEKDNIILNGNGYTLRGSSEYYLDSKLKYGISLYQRQNVTIANLTIIKFAVSCIGIQSSTNNIIIGNYMRQEMNEGMRFYFGASNNTLENNDIDTIRLYSGTAHNIMFSNKIGTLYFATASANIVAGNNITNGIICRNSSNNAFTSNNINVFIELKDNSNSNRVVGNTLSGQTSISIDGSVHNSVYHNNFLNNQSAYAGEQLNTIWDDGRSSGGNYWIDYNGTDNDGDLIGDTPYIINEDNIDPYPLMAPITVFDAGIWEWTPYEVDVISNSTVFDFVFDPDQKKISFGVTDEDQTTGFCRVSIPKDFLSAAEDWIVLLNDNYGNSTITKALDATYIYITYAADEKPSVIEIQGDNAIPEFENFDFLLIFLVGSFVAFAFYKKPLKLIHQKHSY